MAAPANSARADRQSAAPRGGAAGRWVTRWGASRGVALGLAAAIALVDRGVPWQHWGFVPRALVDEPCHLATAVIVLGALTRWRGRPPGRCFAWAMLSASVLIDADHLPLEFGSAAWTAGTPRPYTHALWVVAALALAAAAARRRPPGARARTVAAVAGGAAWGVAAHFLRDVATAPIALWWPVSSVGVSVPHAWYLAALAVLAVLPPPAGRERWRRRAWPPRRAGGE